MSIYETITQRILDCLAAGTVPWRKTWTTGLPKSLGSGQEYRGINLLVLGTTAYRSRYWMTYRQALRLGGHVRQGERATPVVYWKWRTPEELARRREQTGKEEPAPCYPFISAVFNLDQVEGVGRPDDDVPAHGHRPLDTAAQVFEIMPDKPIIEHAVTLEPAYDRRRDCIILPHLSQFESAAEYFGSLYHELVHCTGHKRRLNRFGEAQGDALERYSFEELVAEFGAAFLCGFAGLANPVSDALQAGYIQGWSAVLRQDPRLLVRAASSAQRAADYIRGKGVAAEAPGLEEHRAPDSPACAVAL